jgi:DNA-binding response OmpR family regulator
VRKRILLVGDPATLRPIEELVRLSGCEPVVPSCVSEALAAAEDDGIQMAIAALGTVRLGGWAWLFGARERRLGFPVVALLDRWDWKWSELAYRWGASLVLRPDAPNDDLLALLRQPPSRPSSPVPTRPTHPTPSPEALHAGATRDTP